MTTRIISAASAGRDEANAARASEAARPLWALAAKVLAAYRGRVRLIDGEREVMPGVMAVPLPGHTPGHTGYRVASGGDTLLVWGDLIHAAPVQMPRPDVGYLFDVDRAGAAVTRARVLRMAAADRLKVSGMHLPFPGFGHVVRDGEGFRFVPSAWEF